MMLRWAAAAAACLHAMTNVIMAAGVAPMGWERRATLAPRGAAFACAPLRFHCPAAWAWCKMVRQRVPDPTTANPRRHLGGAAASPSGQFGVQHGRWHPLSTTLRMDGADSWFDGTKFDVRVQVLESMQDVPRADWNRVAVSAAGGEDQANPFLCWEFLNALEESGSACRETGACVARNQASLHTRVRTRARAFLCICICICI